MSTINWKLRKTRDGGLAKTSRIVLWGVGPMSGGIRRAEIRAAIAEHSPAGPCKIMLQFGQGGNPMAPLVWRGEAASLGEGEIVAEEQLPAFGREIMAHLREDVGDQAHLHPSKRFGFDSYPE